jgi:ornithine carbamoyltransferase
MLLAMAHSAAPGLETLKGRDFTRVTDLSRAELEAVLDLADDLKARRQRREQRHLLPGRSLGMIFEKPSTRTRVSFEVGIAELGGVGLHLAAGDLQLGRGETIRDTAQVLSRYLDAIMIRTFAAQAVDELAVHAEIPVINGLTDADHPCQALADVMTIRERLERTDGVRVAYIGDGNNVCVSLAQATDLLGMEFVAATPAGYEPPAGTPGEVVGDPDEAARDADVLYTDVWTSMGQEEDRARRLEAFRGWTLDERLVARAAAPAIVLHCLPAHYGEEIAEDVLYGPQSAVWDQAENKLHVAKALMALVVP